MEKVHIIVMMTNLWEGGRSKCDQYWPSMSKEGTGESREYGPFTVTLEDETTYPDYIIRTMKIQVCCRHAHVFITVSWTYTCI